jgi:hypothetical protein
MCRQHAPLNKTARQGRGDNPSHYQGICRLRGRFRPHRRQLRSKRRLPPSYVARANATQPFVL